MLSSIVATAYIRDTYTHVKVQTREVGDCKVQQTRLRLSSVNEVLYIIEEGTTNGTKGPLVCRKLLRFCSKFLIFVITPRPLPLLSSPAFETTSIEILGGFNPRRGSSILGQSVNSSSVTQPLPKRVRWKSNSNISGCNSLLFRRYAFLPLKNPGHLCAYDEKKREKMDSLCRTPESCCCTLSDPTKFGKDGLCVGGYCGGNFKERSRNGDESHSPVRAIYLLFFDSQAHSK